jgi:hypothetical protein
MNGQDYIRGHERTPRSAGSQRIARQFLESYAVLPLLVLWDIVKSTGGIFTQTWNRFVFGQFWGRGILSADVLFVIDSYEDVRLRSGFRWAEAQSGKESQAQDRCGEIIHGTFAPQAAAMLTAVFLKHTGRAPRIVTDTEVHLKRDATLICYGTSDSNFKTFEIEALSGSDLCQFSFSGSGQRGFRMGGQLHSIERRAGVIYDKAIVLRLASRQHPHHCHVVCAGLSEWGSLAAVSYLTKNWKALHKRFDGFGQGRDFCVLLEVPWGQSETARELASAVWWEPKAARQSGGVLPRWA